MSARTVLRCLIWVGSGLSSMFLIAVLLIWMYGWNWLRAPLERYAEAKTGRILQIDGDMAVNLGWPLTRLRANGVQFANPAWAQEHQLLAAKDLEVTVDLEQLLQHKISFPEVRLDQAVVFLEQDSNGHQSWLLDRDQLDQNAHVWIGHLLLDHGTLGYDDKAQQTRIRVAVSTADSPKDGTANELAFSAQGQLKGLALKLQGTGGPVLALRDTQQAYPMKLQATLGPTRVNASGTVTGLLALVSADLHMAVEGDNMEQLYPLLGIAFPTTRAYSANGRLLHSGDTWRYEQFTGRVGRSDLAGFVQVVTGGNRPQLTADLRSKVLALEDLGPLIGTRQANVFPAGQATPITVAAASAQTAARVLPDLPFHSERWDSVNADVQLHAATIARAKALPLEDLQVHLKMQDAVLTLEPLEFGFAGGRLHANIALDGHNKPIQARAAVQARKLLLSRLFPAFDLTRSSIGELDGEFDLTGSGNSVGNMLATSDGELQLAVSGGQVSRLLMEKAGLHIWEIVTLTLTGDKEVKLRCVVADFDVKHGIMQTKALVFDTQVTTLFGSGSIDLANEKLDLMFHQRTKTTSLIALRSPIYVRGSFANPDAGVDKGRLALRAAGAVALGVINPLLALIPLIDAGPGKDSNCGQLVRDAKALAK